MAQPRVIDAGRWSAPGLAVLSYGFRPFFFAGAAYAALAVPAWLAMLMLGLEPAGPFAGTRWHAHEMIFGYLAAVMAGFALTAVPNWTGRLPLSGLPLAGLCALWLAGRLASSLVPSPAWALLLDGAFLFVLAAALWREILAGPTRHNLPVALLFSLMALANVVFHLEESWPVLPQGLGERLALGVAAMLIALIGGRIVPSFTRNWMARLRLDPLPVPFGRFDRAVLIASGAAVAAWIVSPGQGPTGALLLFAGGLNLVRLARWRGFRTWRDPIVAILHVGYLWLGVSFGLLGLVALEPGTLGASTALHALTAGAIGTMTLAVMTRASLGHTGREIVAGSATIATYCLVNAGALLRLVAPFVGDWYLPALGIGGVLWSAAFALFALAYAPVLLMPGRGRI